MKKPVLLRAAAVLLLIVGAVVAWIYAPLDWDRLAHYVDRSRQLGVWGPVLLAAIYVPATVLMVPGSWLSLAGGFAFGMPRAFFAVSLGSVAGASLAFLVSRYLLRGWIERKLAHNPRFHSLDRAVAEQGFRIVLLARLSPLLPFGVLNYAFGVTKISFGRYVLASWIGMIPGTLAFTYLGSAAKRLTDLVAGHAPPSLLQRVLFYVGLIATISVTALVTRIATKALRETVHDDLR